MIDLEPRDIFAMFALAGLVANSPKKNDMDLAERAYELADAMLWEREKTDD